MKNCPNCDAQFTSKEKLKALNRKYSEIHCLECKAKYRKNNKITTGISIFVAVIILSIITDKIKPLISSYIVRIIMAVVIGAIVCVIVLDLFNLVIKYKRVN